MTLDVRPLGPALGAEIRGVDLRRELRRAHALRHVHPLVIAHPTTGRPLLFCNRSMASAIVGYERDRPVAYRELTRAHV